MVRAYLRLLLPVLSLCLPLCADHPVDRYGQSVLEEWPGKVSGDEQLRLAAAAEWRELQELAPDLVRYDRYFGRRENLSLEATGWFRTQKLDGRWWLITPEGNRFFLQGCDGDQWSEWGYSTLLLTPDGKERQDLFTELPDRKTFADAFQGKGRVSFLTANLMRKYGADTYVERIRDVTARRFLKWGFNAMSKWSFGQYERQFPYIADGSIWGARRFGKGCIDIYDASFPEVLERAVRTQCERHREQRLLIGYSLENENGWHDARLDVILKLDASWAVKGALIDFLGRRHADVGALLGRPGASRGELLAEVKALTLDKVPAADKKAFVLESSERYHRLLVSAYRRHDPHHLVMGAAHCPHQSREWLEGAVRHMDFIGINTYDIQRLWSRSLESLWQAYDKPFAVLEYSFVVEGRGYRRYGHGNTVRDEASRGLAYRYFVERESARSHCIGTGYFLLWDQAVTRRSLPDGENFSFGLLSQCDQPYEEMLRHVEATNRRVFDVHAGTLEPFAAVSPQQLLAAPGVMELFAPFVPGSEGHEVTADAINAAVFNGEPTRIKCTGQAARPGIVPIGDVALGAGRRVTARVFLWHPEKTARVEDAFVVEGSSDGRRFARLEVRYDLVWEGGKVREWRLVVDGLAPELRFVRLNFRTSRDLPLWACQVSGVKSE